MLQALDVWRTEKEIPWISPDWDTYRLAAAHSIKGLYYETARSIPRLLDLAFAENSPDYFGRAVHASGVELFDALEENDDDRFSRLFPLYFAGVLQQYEILRKSTAGWNARSAILTSCQPILDVCDLSGYALIFSDLHSNQRLWATCRGIWDRYFDGEGAETRLSHLVELSKYARSQFVIAERSVLRTRWQMRMQAAIRGLPRRRGARRAGRALPNFKEELDHPSALLRALYHSGDFVSFYDGEMVFEELYLRKLAIAQGVDFGRETGLETEVDLVGDGVYVEDLPEAI